MTKQEEFTRKMQEEQDREALKKICKAFKADEWKTVLSVCPPQALASELVDRATNGERIMKRMREVWDEQ